VKKTCNNNGDKARNLYSLAMYNGTLRAVVIFVDAKIQFLLQISKQCQNFFFHIEWKYYNCLKNRPIQNLYNQYNAIVYTIICTSMMSNIYMTMTYKKPTYTKPIQRTLYMIVPDISPILIIEVWRRTPTGSTYSKPIMFLKL
jgi:hypothetical protein